jgi:hypothetical protein
MAVTRAFAQMNDPEVLLPVSLYEAKKTAATITRVASRLKRAAKWIRKGNKILSKGNVVHSFRSLRHPAKLASEWLEVRYGLRPLYYELKGLYNLIQDGTSPNRRRFKSYYKDTTKVPNWATGVASSLPGNCAVPFRCEKSTTVEISGGVLAEVLRDQMSVADEIGFNSPFSSAWEIVPWSFVVDWFLNTSDLFQSWDPNPSLQTKTWWVVTKEKVTYTTMPSVTFADPLPLSGNVLRPDNPGVRVQAGNCTRAIWHTHRIPTPARQALPLVKVHLDVVKAFDLLALARQSVYQSSRV